jgi:hypothetical protein
MLSLELLKIHVILRLVSEVGIQSGGIPQGIIISPLGGPTDERTQLGPRQSGVV